MENPKKSSVEKVTKPEAPVASSKTTAEKPKKTKTTKAKTRKTGNATDNKPKKKHKASKKCPSCGLEDVMNIISCQYPGCNELVCFKPPIPPFEGCGWFCDERIKESGCTDRPVSFYCGYHITFVIDRHVCRLCLNYVLRNDKLEEYNMV